MSEISEIKVDKTYIKNLGEHFEDVKTAISKDSKISIGVREKVMFLSGFLSVLLEKTDKNK